MLFTLTTLENSDNGLWFSIRNGTSEQKRFVCTIMTSSQLLMLTDVALKLDHVSVCWSWSSNRWNES